MSTISAGTTSTTALVQTANTDGTLQLQVNGTTPAVTLNTSGAIGIGSTPTYGASGQVLTSAGSGAAPTWTTPSSGAMTLLSTTTASNSATVDIVLSGSYTSFEIIFTNLVPASNGTNIKIQYTTNNFSSATDWQNASAYGYSSSGTLTGTAISGVFIQGKSSTASEAAAGCLTIINPFSVGTVVRQVTGLSNGGHYLNGFYTCTFSAANSTSAVLNGVRIIATSGNLTTGTFKLYGIS